MIANIEKGSAELYEAPREFLKVYVGVVLSDPTVDADSVSMDS
jgi:hypothetical protein